MSKQNITKVKVVGGLGNQLFGFFFGAFVSSELQTGLLIDTRLISFGSNKSRKSIFRELRLIKKPISELNTNALNEIFLSRIKLFRKIYFRLIYLANKTIIEEKISDSGFKFRGNQSYSGYFQNWFFVDRYIVRSGDIDLTIIKHSDNYLIELARLQAENPICVHLREGDYRKFPHIYRLIPLNYFEYCLKRELTKDSSRPIWIFTEDVDLLDLYSKSFIDRASRVIDRSKGLTDTESFTLLTKSKTLIATNSTYSLWASWFVWKNGHTAYVPFQSFITSVSNELMDERWNRYDFENDVFYPGRFNQEKYDKSEREFLSKFA